MKHKAPTKQLVTMLAVVVGLALASSTQAQTITLDSNLVPTGPYNGWNGSPPATVTPGPTGIEVVNPAANGYGGEYLVLLYPTRFRIRLPRHFSSPHD